MHLSFDELEPIGGCLFHLRHFLVHSGCSISQGNIQHPGFLMVKVLLSLFERCLDQALNSSRHHRDSFNNLDRQDAQELFEVDSVEIYDGQQIFLERLTEVVVGDLGFVEDDKLMKDALDR
jgi:hypothetical protein